MIDFRYHLVSIFSIFLALAVGIVLGAGPLKEDIGDSLTSEVSKLREEKAALRTEVDNGDKAAKARDAFTAAGNRTLLSGRLSDRTVAVVALPGADANVVKATTETLTDAGARIGSTVTVLDSWVDPDKATFRDTLGQQLASAAHVPVGTRGVEVIDTVLARAVLTKAGASPADSAAALEGLRTGELVRYTPEEVTPATLAVVVAGPVKEADKAKRDAQATLLSSLSAALDAGGSGAVLVEPSADPSATGVTSVVTVARADTDRAKELSTVDDADLPMGQASVVFALVQQQSGQAGHFGLGKDAAAAYPPLAAK